MAKGHNQRPEPAAQPAANPPAADPKAEAPAVEEAKAVTTVVVDCMPVQPGETCWVPTEQAKRLAAKGALKLL